TLANIARGWALTQLGALDKGVALLEAGTTMWERLGMMTTLAELLAHSAEGLLLASDVAKAREVSTRALELSRRLPELGSEAWALYALGRIASALGEDDAAQLYEQSWARAEAQGMRPLVGRCHLGLGEVFRRAGRRDQALEHLSAASTFFREMDMAFWLEKAEAEMRELA